MVRGNLMCVWLGLVTRAYSEDYMVDMKVVAERTLDMVVVDIMVVVVVVAEAAGGKGAKVEVLVTEMGGSGSGGDGSGGQGNMVDMMAVDMSK